MEVDVDALSDGQEVFIAGIMEHIKKQAFTLEIQPVLPPQNISELVLKKLLVKQR